MVDHLTAERRSALMARVRGKNTSPEMIVRRIVHGAGYRYRLHRRDLPGRPDIVFGPRRKVIFVHGCFWHQHSCSKAKRPTTNVELWNEKLDRNVTRDRKIIEQLQEAGWQSLVIWECETADAGALLRRIIAFLHQAPDSGSR